MRVLVFFRVRRPPVFGWSAVETRAALTDAAVWAIALAAWQAGRPDLIRSLGRVLAHVWEGVESCSTLAEVCHALTDGNPTTVHWLGRSYGPAFVGGKGEKARHTAASVKLSPVAPPLARMATCYPVGVAWESVCLT